MPRYAPFKTWISVDSSNLEAVKYDPEKEQLAIRFKGGRTYLYGGVPPSVFLDLLDAPSKGKYVWKHIRDRYAYTEI